MMKYLIIPILILIVLTTIAFLFRRKHIRTVNQLENDKLQIQNQPIFEEMMKVKQLNMTGETEEKFERWRNEWTTVVDVKMPEIDSLLFDAEDFIDRFRFKKVTQIEKEIQEKIRTCDKVKHTILTELNELIGSEEKNRIEMETLKEQYRTARKTLLAHAHSFGLTIQQLEKELASFQPQFEKYEELTKNGNYLMAREIVIKLSARGEHLSQLIQEIPTLLTELQSKIPQTIRELKNGLKEMEEQAYYVNHLEIPAHLETIEKELDSLTKKMEQLEIQDVKIKLQEINDRIDSFYEALEQEVLAKQFVDQHVERIGEHLENVIRKTREIAHEATYVQQSYRLDEEEANLSQVALKKLESLQKRYVALSELVHKQDVAYTILQVELKNIAEELEMIEEEQDQFSNRIQNLRIDENHVRAKLETLKRQMQHTDRKLQRANIPGIPEEIEVQLEEADEQLYLVSQSLLEVPLNITTAQSYVVAAEKAVQDIEEKVNQLLENVMLIEQIIQYGNRYRASNPHVNERLSIAENSFREFRYAKALEEAATAVEEIEPGAIKRIEQLIKEYV